MFDCALVIGCANDVWEEVEEAKRLYNPDCFIAINTAGVDYPRVDHWVSFHVELFPHWIALREKNGFSPVSRYWSSIYQGAPLHRMPPREGLEITLIRVNGGSSGLIGTLVGLKLAKQVVLAGIPLDPDRAHYNKPGEWVDGAHYRAAWVSYLPKLKGKVTSMSGWTKELLES